MATATAAATKITIGSTLRELAGSKKFVVFLVTVLVVLASRFGLDLGPETAERIVHLAIAYLVGQGVADFGKDFKKEGGD